jgi:hypothetical protein
MYSIGYEYNLNNKLSFNAQVGILTKPYDAAILGILELFGTDEPIVNTIGEAFNIGYIIQPTIKYNFNKSYLGLSYSFFSLKANESPVDVLENYYEITLPIRVKENELELRSDLHNIGLVLGRKFQFKDPTIKIHLEVSLAKTIGSNSKISSQYGDLENLSQIIDEELDTYYIDYGYLPSINIFIVKEIK